MKIVNVYDFDHTIYDGDASLDFIIYCLTGNYRLWKYLPSMALVLVLYITGKADRKKVKETGFVFLNDIDNPDELVDDFWVSHKKKIKKLYTSRKKDDDVVISASPEFLLGPIALSQGFGLIATKMNKNTGRITGNNCRGNEKVERFRKEYPEYDIGDVYTDSMSDAPLINIAHKGYMVKKNVVTEFNEYTPSLTDRIKSPEFITFIFVGCVNAIVGISVSYMFSLYIHSPQVAFIIGFTSSLVPSYFLNSVITFADRNFSITKFGKFVLSYVPNFSIMFVFVYIFTDFFKITPLLTYILAVVLAVPITFLLLSVYTFKNKGDSNGNA